VVGQPRASAEGRWIGAVLAGGHGAQLSHRAALALWGLPGGRPERPEITCPAPVRSTRGMIVHSSTVLPADEVTRHRGIPVTTVARTLLDVAAVLSYERFAHAVDIAERRMMGDAVSLRRLLDRHPGRRGIRSVRRLFAEREIGLEVTKQELELRFTEFVARRRLPKPRINALVSAGGTPHEVDCLWEPERLIVELDSRAHHDNATAFESDRERDRALAAAGYRVVRITWRQLHDRPGAIARDIEQTLAVSRVRR
jgi:very-short-patch-repair endonuclease